MKKDCSHSEDDWAIRFTKNDDPEMLEHIYYGYKKSLDAVTRLRETYPNDRIWIEEVEMIEKPSSPENPLSSHDLFLIYDAVKSFTKGIKTGGSIGLEIDPEPGGSCYWIVKRDDEPVVDVLFNKALLFSVDISDPHEDFREKIQHKITEIQLGGPEYGTPTIIRRRPGTRWAIRVYRGGCIHYLNSLTLEWDSSCAKNFLSDIYYAYGMKEAYNLAEEKLKEELLPPRD